MSFFLSSFVSHSRPSSPRFILINVLLLMASNAINQAHALSLYQSICSSENTGSDSTSDIYQSNGACQTTCNGYAYAIVQYEDCWCSNDTPAQSVSPSECSTNCPGYPDEQCGNSDQGLYGYIALGPSPSGVAGSSSSSLTSSSLILATSTILEKETTIQTVSLPPSLITTYITPDSSSSTSTTDTATAAATSSAAKTVTASPVVSTFTQAGQVVTQTVTPSRSASGTVTPISLYQQQVSNKKGPSKGTIAGAVIGSILAFALMLLGAFFMWRRHRKNDEDDYNNPTDLDRKASTMSKAGLLATSSAASDPEKSVGGPASMQPLHAIPAIPSAIHVTPPTHRRDSRPLVYDQRLNPEALMQNWDGNGSRTSVNTMHDQRDYSRPLKVSNPDI